MSASRHADQPTMANGITYGDQQANAQWDLEHAEIPGIVAVERRKETDVLEEPFRCKHERQASQQIANPGHHDDAANEDVPGCCASPGCSAHTEASSRRFAAAYLRRTHSAQVIVPWRWSGQVLSGHAVPFKFLGQ